MNSKLSIALH